MTHRSLPLAPIAIVSGISAVAGIPTIVDARVGRDGLLVLEVLLTEEFPIDLEAVDRVAEYCETTADNVYLTLGPDGDETVIILTINDTAFDFDYLQPPRRVPANTGDSDEIWEAAEALRKGRC